MRATVILFLSFIFYTGAYAQTFTVQQYIDTYKDIAIREMRRVGVPASIILAQGILETENGNSDLVLKSNNHFGIKCKSSWTGESVSHNDDAAGECFRKYDNAEESFRDHSDFLKSSARYAALFNLDPADYKGWAYGLKNAGYATNPRYPQILIKSIEKYNLHQYTLEGLSGKDVFDAGKYIDEKNTAQTISIVPVKMDDTPPASVVKGKRTVFNKLKAIFVPAGTSLLAIATENDIALSKLLEYNDLKADGLLPEDQWIFLEKKAKEGDRDIYISSDNETLYQVAQANGIQMEHLQQYNGLNGNPTLKGGTKISLRPGIAKTAPTPPQAILPQQKMHEVLPREGLYAISKKYNVTVQQLKEWNNLTSDELRVGQQLIISK
jgi:LysM repeat protein